MPFLIRVEGTEISGETYEITTRYTCRTLQLVSGFDRDSGASPALAKGGPQTVVPDSSVELPDDPTTAADDDERGKLSLWGGTFVRFEAVPLPPAPCAFNGSLKFSLLAGSDDVFLLFGAMIAPGAAGGGLPVGVIVLTPAGERRIEIDPVNIVPAP